jgi:hypothetical protein
MTQEGEDNCVRMQDECFDQIVFGLDNIRMRQRRFQLVENIIL